MMTKIHWYLGLCLLPVLVGCRHQTPNAVSEPIAKPVLLAAVREGVEANGEQFAALLSPYSETSLSFRIPGYVSWIYQTRIQSGISREVEPGDLISAGSVLARIRSSEYEAVLDQSLNSSREAIEAVDSARAKLSDAEARATEAESRFDRVSTLWNQQSTTRPAYDSALALRDSARSNVSSAQANVLSAKAHADSVKAQARGARISISDTALTAPYTAVMVDRRIERGSLVQAGSEVMTIADMSRMKVRFNVPDTEAANLRQGQVLGVLTSALGGKVFSADVISVAKAADTRSRAFEVELLVDNKAGLLRSGMIASVRLPGRRELARLTMPSSALLHDPVSGSYRVFVGNREDGKLIARLRNVEIREFSGDMVTLASGSLDRNAMVVVDGAILLKDGDPIRDHTDEKAENGVQEAKR